MRRLNFHYLVVIGLLLGLLIGLTGCMDQPRRFQWSVDEDCLIDHSENMCYESTDEMELNGYNANRANKVWRETYNRARKQKNLTEARRRYEQTQ